MQPVLMQMVRKTESLDSTISIKGHAYGWTQLVAFVVQHSICYNIGVQTQYSIVLSTFAMNEDTRMHMCVYSHWRNALRCRVFSAASSVSKPPHNSTVRPGLVLVCKSRDPCHHTPNSQRTNGKLRKLRARPEPILTGPGGGVPPLLFRSRIWRWLNSGTLQILKWQIMSTTIPCCSTTVCPPCE